MIPKTCPLNDKFKLQTILQNNCAIEEYSESAKDCRDCQYGEGLRLAKERKELQETIERLKAEILRKRKIQQIKEEMMKKQGLPYYPHYDTE